MTRSTDTLLGFYFYQLYVSWLLMYNSYVIHVDIIVFIQLIEGLTCTHCRYRKARKTGKLWPQNRSWTWSKQPVKKSYSKWLMSPLSHLLELLLRCNKTAWINLQDCSLKIWPRVDQSQASQNRWFMEHNHSNELIFSGRSQVKSCKAPPSHSFLPAYTQWCMNWVNASCHVESLLFFSLLSPPCQLTLICCTRRVSRPNSSVWQCVKCMILVYAERASPRTQLG